MDVYDNWEDFDNAVKADFKRWLERAKNGDDYYEEDDNKKKKNIYMIIKGDQSEDKLYDKSNGLDQGAWHIIVSSSIEKANAALGAYLDNDKADNIVISAHGGANGGSMELSEDNPKAVGANSIQAYNNNSFSIDTKLSNDIKALKSVIGKLADGGNLIATGCQAGLGPRGNELGKSLIQLADNRNINIFLNQDLSSQRYTYTGNDHPTGYASIVDSKYENGWGITGQGNYHYGWLKFNPLEVTKNIRVLQLNADRAPYVNYKK